MNLGGKRMLKYCRWKRRRLEKQQVFMASVPTASCWMRGTRDGQIQKRTPGGGSLQMLSRAERLRQIPGKINAQPMGFSISAQPSETLQIWVPRGRFSAVILELDVFLSLLLVKTRNPMLNSIICWVNVWSFAAAPQQLHIWSRDFWLWILNATMHISLP